MAEQGTKSRVMMVGTPAEFTYTNHRGETRTRLLKPIDVWFGYSPHYKQDEPMWFVRAHDTHGYQVKDFALNGFGGAPTEEPEQEETETWEEDE